MIQASKPSCLKTFTRIVNFSPMGCFTMSTNFNTTSYKTTRDALPLLQPQRDPPLSFTKIDWESVYDCQFSSKNVLLLSLYSDLENILVGHKKQKNLNWNKIDFQKLRYQPINWVKTSIVILTKNRCFNTHVNQLFSWVNWSCS